MNEPLLLLQTEIDMDDIEQQSMPWIELLYTTVQQKQKRTVLYRSDFLYEMLPTNDGEFYWMASDHLISVAMQNNEFDAVLSFKGESGMVFVYKRDDVMSAINDIMEMCAEHELKINVHDDNF